MRTFFRLQLAALALIGVGSATGCIDSLEPDVGPLIRESCFDEDSNPDVAVSYSEQIVPLLFETPTAGCLECHAPNAPTPEGYLISGLDVSSYNALRSGGNIAGTSVIIPGQPCESILLQKTAAGPPFGGRMTLNRRPVLSDEQTQLLHDWIVEGAQNN
ncbi:MAG: hypothetical protein JKY56_11240 [Kofleriaceae bacterium]|nr:hypothetical protein [Kofleriaceae bacterium]